MTKPMGKDAAMLLPSTPDMNANISSLAGLIWPVADLLRGDFKQSQYGRIILSVTVLRPLECVPAEAHS